MTSNQGLRVAIAAAVLGAALGLMFGSSAIGAKGGCEWRHFGYDGKPTTHGQDLLATHEVPPGRTWTVTNVSLLAERHSNGTADAGEFTAMAGALSPEGQPSTIAQSSLDAGSGIALQGQGAVKVGLPSGSEIHFAVWLRDGKNLENYYYTLAAAVRDCAN